MGRVFGPETRQIFDGATDVIEIPCGGVSTFYSRSIKLAYGKYFAISYMATSTGVVELKLEFQQSWVLPTTEGSDDANWVEPEGASDINATLADEVWHHESIAPVAMPFLRVKITATGANHASTTLQLKFHMQEEL